MVTKGNRAADVGCDHGFVPIFLVESGISPLAVAADVRPGPLSRAKEHIKEHRLEDVYKRQVQDSAQISNQFFMFTCLGGMLLALIVISVISNRLTRPLLQLAEIADHMANLDFTSKYTGDLNNEIGLLGNSMNSMSEQLESTINQLQTANEQLKKDIDEKIQIDEVRKEFLSNVSHELKTPIALKMCIRDRLRSLVMAYAKKKRVELQAETFASAEELLEEIENGAGFEILFLDIEMRKMDGIELGKKLRERSYQTLIIYVSGYDQYMRQLFEAEPFRFLSKPLKKEELENVLDKAFERISRFHRELFTIRFGKNVVNLLCRDIVYRESNKRKVIVHTAVSYTHLDVYKRQM